jgi:hypothetical protein
VAKRLDADAGLAPMSPLGVVAVSLSVCLSGGRGLCSAGGASRGRTGWCCPSSGGSTEGWGGSASELLQAFAWCGRTCGSAKGQYSGRASVGGRLRTGIVTVVGVSRCLKWKSCGGPVVECAQNWNPIKRGGLPGCLRLSVVTCADLACAWRHSAASPHRRSYERQDGMGYRQLRGCSPRTYALCTLSSSRWIQQMSLSSYDRYRLQRPLVLL